MTRPPPPNPSQALARLLGGTAAARSTRLGVVTLTIIGVALALLALIAWPLIDLRLNPPAPPAAKAPDEAPTSAFENALDGYVAQIDGRALFHKPGPPRPKVEARAPTERSKPTRYGGPSIIAMVNSAVWFSDGQRLGLNESSPSGDLKVVALNAPWSAKVNWDGAEFDVDFFQRSPLLSGIEPRPSFAPDRPLPPTTPRRPPLPTPPAPSPTTEPAADPPIDPPSEGPPPESPPAPALAPNTAPANASGATPVAPPPPPPPPAPEPAPEKDTL